MGLPTAESILEKAEELFTYGDEYTFDGDERAGIEAALKSDPLTNDDISKTQLWYDVFYTGHTSYIDPSDGETYGAYSSDLLAQSISEKFSLSDEQKSTLLDSFKTKEDLVDTDGAKYISLGTANGALRDDIISFLKDQNLSTGVTGTPAQIKAGALCENLFHWGDRVDAQALNTLSVDDDRDWFNGLFDSDPSEGAVIAAKALTIVTVGSFAEAREALKPVELTAEEIATLTEQNTVNVEPDTTVTELDTAALATDSLEMKVEVDSTYVETPAPIIPETEEAPEEEIAEETPKEEVVEQGPVKKVATIAYDERVMQVQSLLYLSGLTGVGRVDGKLGSLTQNEIDAYIKQTDGLDDGADFDAVYENLTDRLQNDAAFSKTVSEAAISAIENSTNTDFKGDDFAVRAAQGLLRMKDYEGTLKGDASATKVRVDGDPGPQTLEALATFKKDLEITTPEIDLEENAEFDAAATLETLKARVVPITEETQNSVQQLGVILTNADLASDHEIMVEYTKLNTNLEDVLAHTAQLQGSLGLVDLKQDEAALKTQLEELEERTTTLETQRNQIVTEIMEINARINDELPHAVDAAALGSIDVNAGHGKSLNALKAAFSVVTEDIENTPMDAALRDVDKVKDFKRLFENNGDYYEGDAIKEYLQVNNIAFLSNREAVKITGVSKDGSHISYLDEDGKEAFAKTADLKGVGDSSDLFKDAHENTLQGVNGQTLTPGAP